MSSSSRDHPSPPVSASRERVILKELGPLLAAAAAAPPAAAGGTKSSTGEEEDFLLASWPSGDFLLQPLLPKYAGRLPSTDPQYWQTCARRALLTECGFLPANTQNKNCTAAAAIDDNGEGDGDEVQKAWEKLAASTSNHVDINDDDNDLIQFFRGGGLSNHRNLHWTLMDCAPGCQFHLHAHPNLELVYCVQGELHEIRLQDDDNIITKSFEPAEDDADDDSSTKNNKAKNIKLKGPSLIGCPRPWRFGTLTEGKWLVNRVGTVHKSFTATNGEGCILLTLWGGSHANITDEPALVTNALETMDQKLQNQCAGCHPTADELQRISETFLPESERSSSNNKMQ